MKKVFICFLITAQTSMQNMIRIRMKNVHKKFIFSGINVEWPRSVHIYLVSPAFIATVLRSIPLNRVTESSGAMNYS